MMIFSLLAILTVTFASIEGAKVDANAITPLYKECLMHIVMETEEFPEECETEIELREGS